MTLRKIVLAGVCFLFAATTHAAAQSPEEKGRQVATAATQAADGFGDFKTGATLTSAGSERKLRLSVLETPGGGEKLLMAFDHPRDVKGTNFLSYTYLDKAPDQWLYLPALKRVKRIASRNQSGPFMGSELSYEDLPSREVTRYTHKHLRNEQLDGRDHFVVEENPGDPHSGYDRQVVWYDAGANRISRIDSYDRKNQLLKTATFSDYRQYQNKHWYPGKISVTNHQTKKTSDLNFSGFQFRTGLTDRDFSKAMLKRAR